MNNRTGPVVNQVKKWYTDSWSNFLTSWTDGAGMVVHLLLLKGSTYEPQSTYDLFVFSVHRDGTELDGPGRDSRDGRPH